jgi:hypothetical protein
MSCARPLRRAVRVLLAAAHAACHAPVPIPPMPAAPSAAHPLIIVIHNETFECDWYTDAFDLESGTICYLLRGLEGDHHSIRFQHTHYRKHGHGHGHGQRHDTCTTRT